MKKLSTILLIAVTLTGFAAAQSNNTQVEINYDTGLIGADHPLYFLETSVTDPIRNSIGLTSYGEIARERAAEAKKAARNGLRQAQQNALQNFEAARKNAENAGDVEPLQQAEIILKEVKSFTPEQADQGLTNAIDNAINKTRGQADNLSEKFGAGNEKLEEFSEHFQGPNTQNKGQKPETLE